MPTLENKPAPGQTGPKGMSPRTTYSKVNTGSPPVLDAGASAQKSTPNRGMEFLPAKIAEQRGSMTTMHERPSLQAMVKAAMSGSSNALKINLEASHQASVQSGSTKTASAKATNSNSVPTEMVHKLAGALRHIEQVILKEAEGVGPGEGPGALQVMEATSSGGPILEGGDSGQATAGNQPPRNPALQADKAQEGNAGTGLETNDDMQHPEQPVEPIKNAAAALPSGKGFMARKAGDVVKNVVGKAKEVGSKAVSKGKELGSKAGDYAVDHPKRVGAAVGAAAAGAGGALGLRHAKKKEGSAPIALLRKLAEDAINPANITAEKGQDPMTPPEGASAAGEGVPSEPSDVTSQKSMIASNEAAINYTKGQAKADPKKDVNQVLNEPALSSSTDKVLQEAFDNTGRAGVKISSANSSNAVVKVAAQRLVLNNLLKRAGADVQKGQ